MAWTTPVDNAASLVGTAFITSVLAYRIVEEYENARRDRFITSLSATYLVKGMLKRGYSPRTFVKGAKDVINRSLHDIHSQYLPR